MKQIGLFKNENVPVPLLPQVLTYAIFDGSSWFDTLWQPTVSDNITKIDVLWYACNISNYKIGYGTPYGIPGASSDIYMMYINGTRLQVRFGNGTNWDTYTPDQSSINIGDKLNWVIERNLDTNKKTTKFYKNNVLIATTSESSCVPLNASRSFWIGATSPGWEPNFIGWYGSCTFYSGNTVLHDYKFKDFNGTGKMVDSVNGDVFENAGTGHITVVRIY